MIKEIEIIIIISITQQKRKLKTLLINQLQIRQKTTKL